MFSHCSIEEATVTAEPTTNEPTAAEALDEARRDIGLARTFDVEGDHYRRGQYARSAIDLAATSLLDPTASEREVVAARSFLKEALALDGRANAYGSDQIHTEDEAAALSEDDQRWLDDYLANRPAAAAGQSRSDDYSIGL